MGKNSKGNAGELPAALEKVLRQLTQEVDRKLGQLQEAIAAARDALRRHQGEGGSKKKKGKSAPSWDGNPPPPKKKHKDATALRWDGNPPPPRQAKVAADGEGELLASPAASPETAWDSSRPPSGRRTGVAAAKGPTVKKPVAKKPAAKKPVAKKPVAKKPAAKKPAAKKPVVRPPKTTRQTAR